MDYILKIYNKCVFAIGSTGSAQFSLPNNYYLPKFSEYLINLFAQFPVWTNVMNKFFSSNNTVSTSASSECYYRIMRRDYQMNCPISLNRFILSHLEYINGATKLGRTTIKKWKQQTNDSMITDLKNNERLPEVVPGKLKKESESTTL